MGSSPTPVISFPQIISIERWKYGNDGRRQHGKAVAVCERGRTKAKIGVSGAPVVNRIQPNHQNNIN